MTKQNQTKNQTKIKTSNWGLSVGQQVDRKDVKDIKLLGVSEKNLKLANCIYDDLPEVCNLENVSPLNTKFFYKVEDFDDKTRDKRKLLGLEVGLGEIVKRGNSFFLERQKCKRFYSLKGGNSSHPHGIPYDFSPSSYLIVTSYAPESFKELFLMEDTVICSLGNGRPELVPLEDNSVLGKVNGDIRSTTVQELFLANDLPILTKSDRIELAGKNSIFIANSIALKSARSRPPNPQAGTIIYNSRKKTFEGFDGEKWKALKWED